MVTCLSELRAARTMVQAEQRALRGDREVALGAMIEVPIAAVTADLLAREVDFVSIGTNDLTQYRACRGPWQSARGFAFRALHPGGLAARCAGRLRYAHGGGRLRCGGAIASDPRAVRLLVGLGVTGYRRPSRHSRRVKAFIATLTSSDCRGCPESS